MQKAKWVQEKDNFLQCKCCPRECCIPEDKTGFCGTYRNQNHVLLNQRYFRFSSVCLDPIEKKPLYHFYPSHHILSLGSYGCNMSCFYCQNHTISQNTSLGSFLSCQDIILKAKTQGAIGIALTYNEPLVNFETAFDLFQECKKNNLQTVLVTNGYIQRKPLLSLIKYVDAVNLDIKFPTNQLYEKYTGASLTPVLQTFETLHQSCHLEVTYLVVPGINDSDSSITDFVSIVCSVDSTIPVHFNAYFPNYKSTIPPTSPHSIQKICSYAKQHLANVYGGNLSGELFSSLRNTYCPQCKSLWVERNHLQTRIHNIENLQCTVCGHTVHNFKGSLS